MADVLHLTGPVLVGAGDLRADVWVVDGRVTFTKPAAEAQTVDGWVLPGLVDAHCHIGLGPDGGLRIGMAPYTDDADIDRLLEALADLLVG